MPPKRGGKDPIKAGARRAEKKAEKKVREVQAATRRGGPAPPKSPPGIPEGLTFADDVADRAPEDAIVSRPTAEEARARAEQICTCLTGPDDGCPKHGTDAFAREVKTGVAAELIRTGDVTEEDAKAFERERRVRQKDLAGDDVDDQGVEHEELEPRHKFTTSFFRATIPVSRVRDIKDVGPTTDAALAIIAEHMSARPDAIVIPQGAHAAACLQIAKGIVRRRL